MAEFNTDGTLTLVNGRGQFRHKIQSPAESVNAFVNCKILTPVNWTGDAIIDLPSMRIVDKASPPPSSGATYTITSVRSGNTVNFTVKANPLTSIDPVSVTITEYRPGSPNVIINTRVINVAPVNGIGTTTYTISQTQPSVDQKVEGKLTNTPSVRTEVTVPKYVAPPPPDYIRGTVTVIPDNPVTNNMPLSGTITGTVTWSGWGGLYITSGRYNIYAGVMVSSNSQGQQTTPLNSASGSFRFSIPYALTSSTQTNRQILVTATGPGTAQHIKEGKIMPHPG